MTINISLACDDKYSQHLAVVITSILKNHTTNEQIDFYILNNNISEENKNKLNKLSPNINYIFVDESKLKNFPIFYDWINISTYYRILLPSLLPNIEKIIYLDCDVVVISEISDLFYENIEEYYAAGVEDIHHKITYLDGRIHVNAGVMLFNLRKMREDKIQEICIEEAENKDRKIFSEQDQSLINHVMKGKIKKLDFKWNLQSMTEPIAHKYMQEIELSRENPSIIHFKGNKKPWVDRTIPKADLYYEYLQYTPFSD